MAHLKLAIVSYVHEELKFGRDGGTIGEAIDNHLREQLSRGHNVQEVSLYFETEQEQHSLREHYAISPVVYAEPYDDGAKPRRK